MKNVVYKFGGALLKDKEGFHYIRNILQKEIDAPNNADNTYVLVVSALAKNTAMLKEAASTASAGNYSQSAKYINDVCSFHQQIAEAVLSDDARKTTTLQYIDDAKNEMLKIVEGIAITEAFSFKTLDKLAAHGEMLASLIVCEYLKQFFNKVGNFDITEIMLTDSTFGNAVPNIDAIQQATNATLPLLTKHFKIIVTQGYIGKNTLGETTTMGLESSNLSATLLAGMLKANELTIWTDTEGIRQSDPNIKTKTKPKVLKHIDYDYAEKLAKYGLKTIYEPMIAYAKNYGLSIHYKSGINPDGEFTTINSDGKKCKDIVIITSDGYLTFEAKDAICKDETYNNNTSYSDIMREVPLAMSESAGIVYDGSSVAVFCPKRAIRTNQKFKSLGFEETDNVAKCSVFNYQKEQLPHLISMLMKNDNVRHFYVDTKNSLFNIYYIQTDENKLISDSIDFLLEYGK